jgi:hypothetical protein
VVCVTEAVLEPVVVTELLADTDSVDDCVVDCVDVLLSPSVLVAVDD